MKTSISNKYQNESSILLDTTAASRLLGVSKSFLDKKRVAGGGPLFCKVGRRVLYDRRDLERWIADRRYSSTSEVQAQ